MKRKILGYLLFLAVFSGTLTSCIDEEFEELGDAGQTFVKTMEQPTFFFSPFEDTKKIDAFSIRRDANSNAALQQSVTLRLVPDASLLPDGYELLPDNFYTLAENTGFEKSGDGFNVNFGKGDFAKTLTINIDGSKWTDVSKKYALAFKIEDAGGLKIADGRESVVLELAIKNKYDGNYEVTATAPMVDVTNASLTGYYPLKADLQTVGPNSVVMFTYTYLQGYWGHPIKSSGNDSYYGNFAPIFTMDSEGNVIEVTNYFGQGTNTSTRSARLNPDGVNKFTVNADGSKTLKVSYIMVQGGNDRTFFHEEWTFKGER